MRGVGKRDGGRRGGEREVGARVYRCQRSMHELERCGKEGEGTGCDRGSFQGSVDFDSADQTAVGTRRPIVIYYRLGVSSLGRFSAAEGQGVLPSTHSGYTNSLVRVSKTMSVTVSYVASDRGRMGGLERTSHGVMAAAVAKPCATAFLGHWPRASAEATGKRLILLSAGGQGPSIRLTCSSRRMDLVRLAPPGSIHYAGAPRGKGQAVGQPGPGPLASISRAVDGARAVKPELEWPRGAAFDAS